MKRSILLCYILLASFSAIHAQSVTQERAWEIVLHDVLGGNVEKVNVFVSRRVIPSGSTLRTIYRDEKSPAFDAWFFFIDDKPFANWNHPCRYVFVNARDGRYTVSHRVVPPLLEAMEPLVEKKIAGRGKLYDLRTIGQIRAAQPRNSATNDYAVIISGGANRDINWERYWNDCAAIYSALVNVYGYPKEHIYVLISDGTDPGVDRRRNDGIYDSSPLDLDGDGLDDTQYAATRANITYIFNTLRNTLTTDDNLFIYVTDHGGQASGQRVYINLWNQTMHDDEFAAEVNKVNAGRVNICMEQCHSGGFINDLRGSNRVIATACRYDESSYAMPPHYLYNEFVYHWTAAIAGQTPEGRAVNADANGDGVVSMEEAFLYAKKQDSRPETPQYSSTPADLGRRISLLNGLPISISGPSDMCDAATYTLAHLPEGAIVQWSCGPGLQLVSAQGNQATFRKVEDCHSRVLATVSLRGTVVQLSTPPIIVGSPGVGFIDFYPSGGMDFDRPIPGEQEEGYWCSNRSGNRFEVDVEEPTNYASYEVSLYRIVGATDFVPVDHRDGVYSGGVPFGWHRPGWYLFKIRGENSCGFSAWGETEVEILECFDEEPPWWRYTLSPNPASGAVTVAVDGQETLQLAVGEGAAAHEELASIRLVEVYDWQGQRVLRREFGGGQPSVTLGLEGLRPGVYTVVVNGSARERLVVE